MDDRGKTNIERADSVWFALADAEHCRLLRADLTERGTLHVEEQEAIENTLPEAEHMRPMTQDGMTHDIEEEERRFAGQIEAWLQKKAKQHRIDHLVLFAPARMLGVLRKAPPKFLKHMEELQGDLMRLNAGQLADHPMIHQLLTPAQEK